MYEHIVAARKIIGEIKAVSDKTAKDYLCCYKKIKDNGITANTSKSYYHARAAFLYGSRLELKELLTLRDRNVRFKELDVVAEIDKKIKDIVKKMGVFLEDEHSLSANLEKVKLHQTLKKTGLADGDIATWTTHKQDNNITVQKHSKRNDVKFWQDEFDNIFLNEIDQKYKQWLAMMMIAGVRPDELDKGNVWFRREGNVLAIQVHCSKQKEGEVRQELRTIRIEHDPSNVALDFIFKLSSGTPAQPDRPGVKHPVKAMSKVLANIGKRLKPSAPNLSSYVYRHAFAANLKASGIDAPTIAMALGHTNTKTQSCYGNSKSGKSNVKIDADASHGINDNRHDYTPPAPKISTNVQNQRPEPIKGLRSGPAAPLKPSNYQISSDSGPGW